MTAPAKPVSADQALYAKTVDGYIAHFQRVGARLLPICEGLEVAVNADTIQAVAFTTYRLYEDAKTKRDYTASKPAPTHTGSAAGTGGTASAPPSGSGASGVPKLTALGLCVNVGDEAVLVITDCRNVEGTIGKPETYFGGRLSTGAMACAYINPATAERQLGRMGIDMENLALVVGRSLKFSRAANAKLPDKPYWNIDDVTQRPPAAAKPKATPAPAASDFDEFPGGLVAEDDLPFD